VFTRELLWNIIEEEGGPTRKKLKAKTTRTWDTQGPVLPRKVRVSLAKENVRRGKKGGKTAKT